MKLKSKPKSYFKLFLEVLLSIFEMIKGSYYDDKGKLKVDVLEKLLEVFFVYSLLLFAGAAVYSLYSYRSPHFMEGLYLCFTFGILLILVQKGFMLLFYKFKIEKLRFISALSLIILGGAFGRTLLIL